MHSGVVVHGALGSAARMRPVAAALSAHALSAGEAERPAERLSNATSHLFADVPHSIERVPVQHIVDGMVSLILAEPRG